MRLFTKYLFFSVQNKIVETDFLVPFPIPVPVPAAKRMSGNQPYINMLLWANNFIPKIQLGSFILLLLYSIFIINFIINITTIK